MTGAYSLRSDNFYGALAVIAFISFAACVSLDFFFFASTTIFPDEQRFLTEAAGLANNLQFHTDGAVAWEIPGTALFFAPFASLRYRLPIEPFLIAMGAYPLANLLQHLNRYWERPHHRISAP